MARLGHKRHGFNKFANKVIKKVPIGLKSAGKIAVVGGTMLGKPELVAAGYEAKRLGKALEK